MTVETTARKQSFAGGQDSLDFTFKVLPGHPDHVAVKTVLISTGAESDLTYTTDYSVDLNSDGVGGTVSIVTSVSTLYTYTVYRETTNKQESDYDDYNQFPADTIEKDLDRRTMVAQENNEEAARTLKLPISTSLSDIELPAPEADKIFGWNSDADGIENKVAVDADVAAAVAASASSASTSAISAATSATTAVTAAAKIPDITTGDAYKKLMVKSDESGAEYLDDYSSIGVIFDGGGVAITAGTAGTLYLPPIPFACTIVSATLTSDVSCTAVVDVWKDTYANYPPTVADTIVSGSTLAISAALKGQDTSLTGWTTDIAEGDVLAFNVDSNDNATKLTASLRVKRKG